MGLSYQIIKDLYLKNRNFCSEDYSECLAYIQDILPGRILSFTSNEEVNGWVIPPKWDLMDAYILKGGKKILNATEHPLQVIGLSKSFNGQVLGGELKKHLHYQAINNLEGDVIPFHFRQFYNSWNRDWGFCVTESFYSSIEEDAEYEVFIETKEQPGNLQIFDYTIQGELEQTVCFVAHLDHPGMANDDLAGCAVGIELFKRLSEKKTKFTYKLLLVQEITGSVYYLNALTEQEKQPIFSSVFLEMLGTNTPLKLQKAFSENPIEFHLARQLDLLNQATSEDLFYDFRELIGNDEIVFEAYNIPMSSVSRYPYKEYHTSLDNIDLISKEALEESISYFQTVITDFENDPLIIREFEGLIALSNPKYDLYIDLQQLGEQGTGLRHLMDFIAFMKRPYALSELSMSFDIPKEMLLTYLQKWEEKKLIRIA